MLYVHVHFFLDFQIIYILYAYVSEDTHEHVLLGPLRPEEGVRFLVSRVIGACEPTDIALGSTF